MTNTINKVIQNGTEYLVGGVTSVNGQQGAVTVEPGITKIFTLSSTSDLTTAQDAYDWYANGGNPIIKSGNRYYGMYNASSTSMYFSYSHPQGQTSTQSSVPFACSGYKFTISSGEVTAITGYNFQVNVTSTVPTLDQKDRITFVI